MKPIDSIFISGWEYNIILDPDPCSSTRLSALPASVFWDSGSIFWMFREVICTDLSFQGEAKAVDDLGWASGKVLSEMAGKDMEILSPLSLSKDLTTEEKEEIRLAAEQLTAYGITKNYLYDRLASGDDMALEWIKLNLFRELMKSRGCMPMPSPNSIGQWFENTKDAPVESANALSASLIRKQVQWSELLNDIARPLTTFPDYGFRLIGTPSSLIDVDQMKAQNVEEEKTQKPLIPELFVGDLTLDDYHKEVRDGNSSVYDPLSHGMWASWNQNKSTLMALRKAAEKHLWNNLHNDWLPAIVEDFREIEKIRNYIDKALRKVISEAESNVRGTFADCIYPVESVVLILTTAYLAKLGLGADPSVTASTVSAVATTSRNVLETPLKMPDRQKFDVNEFDAIENLAAFYQSAGKILA